MKSSVQKALSILEKISPENLKDCDEATLEEYRRLLNPYGTTVEGKGNYLTFSYTNLSQEYMKKFLITSFIAFLNNACDSWNVPPGVPVVSVYDHVENPGKLAEFAEQVKEDKVMSERAKENEKFMAKRLVVKEFLEHVFQFNPDEHVRSAYVPNVEDPSREVIRTPAAHLAIDKLKKEDVKFRQSLLEHQRTQTLMEMAKSTQKASSAPYTYPVLNDLVSEDKHVGATAQRIAEDANIKNPSVEQIVYNMIPAADLFNKFTTYYEVNYDKLLSAVNNLYCDKPDFDIAFNPLQWHDSVDDAKRFIEKHQNDVITSIMVAQSGKWTIVAPYKTVRENQMFINAKNKVLGAIMEETKRSSKLAEDMVKKRISVQKKKNIREAGPDDPQIKAYKEHQRELNKGKGIEQFDYKAEDEDATNPSNGAHALETKIVQISAGGMDVKLRKLEFAMDAEATV
jgi:hypothetical protein